MAATVRNTHRAPAAFRKQLMQTCSSCVEHGCLNCTSKSISLQGSDPWKCKHASRSPETRLSSVLLLDECEIADALFDTFELPGCCFLEQDRHCSDVSGIFLTYKREQLLLVGEVSACRDPILEIHFMLLA